MKGLDLYAPAQLLHEFFLSKYDGTSAPLSSSHTPIDIHIFMLPVYVPSSIASGSCLFLVFVFCVCYADFSPCTTINDISSPNSTFFSYQYYCIFSHCNLHVLIPLVLESTSTCSVIISMFFLVPFNLIEFYLLSLC